MVARIVVRSLFASVLASGSLGLLAASGGCSLVVERNLKAGIGEACATAEDCQGAGAACTDSICTIGCATDSECPSGSSCSPELSQCFQPLKIGAVYIGNSGEGWTKTHSDGLAEVAAKLGFPQVTAAEGVVPGPQEKGAQETIEKFISEGNTVIVATSTSYTSDIAPIAARHPEVKFLVCEGTTVTANLGSYYGRREQAWYIAGQVAAKASTTGKLGVVGSFVSPDTVRNINAFLLGARKIKPLATVEVRWSGFWFDYSESASFWDGDPEGSTFCTQAAPCYLEEYLTDKLIAGGADVVTHQTDVDRSINFVESYNRSKPAGRTDDVFSVANNNRYGCRAAGSPTGSVLPSCLSAVYWNWTPLYTRLFSEMRFNKWVPSDIYENIKGETEREQSIVGVEQSERGNNALGQFELNTSINAIASDPDPYAIFSGAKKAYKTNDRAGGDVTGPLGEEEVLKMCWFAEGVVEPKDDACAENPTLPDCTVPARVPRAGRTPWKALPPFGETTTAFDCVAHGGI